MVSSPLIDTAFDVCTDAGGRDPDAHSPTLRRYHQLLWSRPLPGGGEFALDDRLRHVSEAGAVWLSSDAITNTYAKWSRPAWLTAVLGQVPEAEVRALRPRLHDRGVFGLSLSGQGKRGVAAVDQPRARHEARGARSL